MTTVIDPGVQPAPVNVEPDHDADAALAIAAAFLVVRGLAAAWLGQQQPSESAARRAWAIQSPIWLKLAAPPLARAYGLGGLSPDQAQRAATAYAASLGDHLAQSSGDALIAGYSQQLAARWPERTAWQRASAGYGLDGPRMLAWVKSLLTIERIPDQKRVDDLLLKRAVLLGETEAWRAMTTGKTLAWVWMEASGLLEPGTMKMWRTRRDELTCPFCRDLDGQVVPITEPFRYPDGTAIFSPPSHPNCRCEPDLIRAPLAKAWSPEQEREHPRGGDPDNPGRFRRVETAEPATLTDPATAYSGAKPATAYSGRPAYARAPSAYARTAYTAAPATAYAAKTEPEAAAASAYPLSAYKGKPVPAQRIFLVIPRRRGRGELGGSPEPDTYFITRRDIENEAVQDMRHLLPTRRGHPMDFDRITLARHLDPVQMAEAERTGAYGDFNANDLTWDDDHDQVDLRLHAIRMARGEGMDGNVAAPGPVVFHFWNQNPPDAARHEAVTRVRETLYSSPARLSDADVARIFHLADWDGNEEGRPPIATYSNDERRKLILESVQHSKTVSDVYLAKAYQDYVTFVRPQATGGPAGAHLHQEMGKAGRYGMTGPAKFPAPRSASLHFDHVPVQDVYLFTRFNVENINVGEMSQDEHRTLTGRYKVEHVSYEQLSDVPGVAAVRVFYMVPAVIPGGSSQV